MTPARQKVVAWGAMALGGVGALALASRSGAQADLSRALGWSLLAATALSWLLRPLGRRLVAALALALSAGLLAVVLAGEGHRTLLVAGGLGLVGAATQLLCAGRWPVRASRYDRAPVAGVPASDLEVWKALDAGLDPTEDGFGDSLDSRKTSRNRTNQEDQ